MPIYAQWVQQTSGTGENLNDVYCITADIVVVVGDNGTILKTIDGGTTWVQKNSGTSYNLEKIQFTNQTIGYTIGADSSLYFGTLLKTVDGGETWNTVLNFGTSNKRDISCVSENIFYYVNNNMLFKTVDGGNNFQIINTTEYMQNIQFINDQIGYGLGSNGLVKTIDGGITWTFIRNDVDVYYFLNENIAFFKGINGLSKTIDGGTTLMSLTPIDHSMQKLFATNENIIWGVSGDLLLNGQPNYTTRGEISGIGLFQKINASNPIFKSIYFDNLTKGYGVALAGKIYKNTTGTMLELNEINNEKFIKIYPNPTSDQINIGFREKSIQPFFIEITDTLGKIIFSELYNDKDFVTINTKSISKGIYLLSVMNQEKRQIQKLIIN